MTKRRFSTTLSSRVGLHAEMQPHNDSIKPYFVRNEKKILPVSRYQFFRCHDINPSISTHLSSFVTLPPFDDVFCILIDMIRRNTATHTGGRIHARSLADHGAGI